MYRKPTSRSLPYLLATAGVLLALACPSPTPDAGDPSASRVVEDVIGATLIASDEVPIVYDAIGGGETTLLFIHCWACNRGFWGEQIVEFTDAYRVVALDLAGHGESGAERESWTITGLARDVVALADELGLERMVLVGHSMGGPVALEAARLMPGRVLGVVAVDTLQDADFVFPEELAAQMIASFENDFAGTMTNMFSGMAAASMDESLRVRIVDEAVAANPEVAVALMKDFPNLDFPEMFTSAGVPIRAINANSSTAVPTNVEGNRKYADFDAVLVDDVGHFLQLEKPGEFNAQLRKVLGELTAESVH